MMWEPWGWGMWLGSVVFLVLIAIGIVMLVRWASRDGLGGRAPDPRRILDERFARGEIDEEEYQRRRSVLKGSSRR